MRSQMTTSRTYRDPSSLEGVHELAEWLEDTVSHIATRPASVNVDIRTEAPNKYNLIINLHPRDRGLIIGTRGTTIEALRLLTRKQAYRIEADVRVNLVPEK